MNFIHSLPQIRPPLSVSLFLQTETMAACRSLSRPTTQIAKTVRFASTSTAATTKPSHHNQHQQNHKFLEPNSFIGSWESPRDPKEAQSRLVQLRRDYAKQVKELRKEYIREVELARLEKLRKDEARREALRVQNEERKKQKAEVAKARAQERQVAEQEFRQTLVCALSVPSSLSCCFLLKMWEVGRKILSLSFISNLSR